MNDPRGRGRTRTQEATARISEVLTLSSTLLYAVGPEGFEPSISRARSDLTPLGQRHSRRRRSDLFGMKHKRYRTSIRYRPALSKVLTFTVALKKEDTGGYSVRCVELPAAISQGETEQDALMNIREAIELVLEELESRAQARKPDKLEVVTVTV